MKNVALLALALVLLFGIAVKILPPFGGPALPASRQKDIYLAFTNEVWDTIKTNYWEKISDEQLADLFVAATEKITAKPQSLEKKDRPGVTKLVSQVLKEIPEPEKKKESVTKLADIVLANLQPFGRSRLYTQKEEKELSQNVQNITQVNQYEVLGLPQEASSAAIAQAYQQKAVELQSQANKSPEAAQKLAQVKKAYQVLSDQATRQVYDRSGAEPTMEYKMIEPDIFWLHISKFSPTTLDELGRISEKTNQWPPATTLILDLRDNVGGAIDGLPWFLGPFIGQDQYAYQFFHQGSKTDYKTKIGWLPGLVKFKKVVVLINENTQSTAELMAATLKKYNVGVLVGKKTKGWGTVEKVFPLGSQLDSGEKYSIFLVHSLALREDGQPLEGRGVEPVIDIGKQDWEKEFYSYFRYPELTAELKKIL